MKFARRLYLYAGIYGIIVLLPQYFMEAQNSINYPPPISHPEYYYGFIGVALVWQVFFILLSTDPIRYRTMMIPAVLEKISFGAAAVVLTVQDRTGTLLLVMGVIDLLLGVLFLTAFLKTSGYKIKMEFES